MTTVTASQPTDVSSPIRGLADDPSTTRDSSSPTLVSKMKGLWSGGDAQKATEHSDTADTTIGDRLKNISSTKRGSLTENVKGFFGAKSSTTTESKEPIKSKEDYDRLVGMDDMNPSFVRPAVQANTAGGATDNAPSQNAPKTSVADELTPATNTEAKQATATEQAAPTSGADAKQGENLVAQPATVLTNETTGQPEALVLSTDGSNPPASDTAKVIPPSGIPPGYQRQPPLTSLPCYVVNTPFTDEQLAAMKEPLGTRRRSSANQDEVSNIRRRSGDFIRRMSGSGASKSVSPTRDGSSSSGGVGGFIRRMSGGGSEEGGTGLFRRLSHGNVGESGIRGRQTTVPAVQEESTLPNAKETTGASAQPQVSSMPDATSQGQNTNTGASGLDKLMDKFKRKSSNDMGNMPSGQALDTSREGSAQ
ncbi:hypothetical protein BZG36_02316 [Bifiguratus adelaidae]|uniref:Uncharacterized protein n=1 Tax=Bifiguratus adelaidae TaxID=1938954 RepID=A0A261Y3M3_9FUNG|nr:hypothetical protein BZG36_02316 [Bifiguratus adelaidae]